MTNIVSYNKTPDTRRPPSPIIWGNCPWMEIKAQVAQGAGGVAIGDDFSTFGPVGGTSATSVLGHNGYEIYGDIGVLFSTDSGSHTAIDSNEQSHSILTITGNDADTDYGAMSSGPCATIGNTAGRVAKMWFECRWSTSTVANDGVGTFIGLAYDHTGNITVATAPDVLLGAGDSNLDVASSSCLGFHIDAADGDAMDIVYKADGQTAQIVKAGALVPVVNTFYKLGMVYDPGEVDAKKIRFYVDGTDSASYVTTTDIDAATFPEDEQLAMNWSTSVGTAAAAPTHLDWWRFAQMPIEAD